MGRTITVNWIDWITLAIVLVSILRGTRFGALAGALDLVALMGSFFAASVLYPGLVPSLHGALFLPESWAGMLAFVFIWLALYVTVGIIIRLAHGVKTVPISEILGGVLGVFRGLALMTVFLVIMQAAPFHESIDQDVKQSPVASFLLVGYNAVMDNVAPTLPVRIPRLGPGGTVF
jgi:uncharacterized membrane protein required for colicin V production